MQIVLCASCTIMSVEIYWFSELGEATTSVSSNVSFQPDLDSKDTFTAANLTRSYASMLIL